MRRLLPNPGPTTLEEQLGGFDPASLAGTERPYLYTNFAVTVDGHATIEGRSGGIGSDADTTLLMGLREGADAVMIGAGTLRAEKYGRLLPGAERRRRRRRRGLPADPLAVVVSNRLELPWEAGLFTCGEGRVVVFTASSEPAPETATPVEVIQHREGVRLGEAAAYLRSERGIRALLCEGGPHLHGDLLAAGLVDELFVTLGPKLAGDAGPGLVERLPASRMELELRWLLEEGSELFARYAIRS